MSRRALFTLPGALPRDPAVAEWMNAHPGDFGDLARHWFGVIKSCGGDVREILHDGRPTACVGGAAFAYVDAFKSHAAVGFFHGAELVDAAHLLEGTGRAMRHVKLSPNRSVDDGALSALIHDAYEMMKHDDAMEE